MASSVWELAFDPTLKCGHEDDDPCVWHNDEDGEQVCSECCVCCGLYSSEDV